MNFIINNIKLYGTVILFICIIISTGCNKTSSDYIKKEFPKAPTIIGYICKSNNNKLPYLI